MQFKKILFFLLLVLLLVQAELYIGLELVQGPRIKAQKAWNGKKVKCVAKKVDISRSEQILLEAEVTTLNVKCKLIYVLYKVENVDSQSVVDDRWL